ncbi:Macrophage erythroblast attacher [Nymphon striatum]|nr:Macrophage erythroblast attacher [Nymphon striatum]
MRKIEAMGDLKALEHPTLKVPYEILNKKFRAAQKNIDREVSHVQSVALDLEKELSKSPPYMNDITRILGGVVEKLNILKRKAEESITEELDAAKACKRRTAHLKEKEFSNGSNETALNAWKKTRLDRILVEYFLRSGFYNSAIKLAKHSQIEDLTNIDIFLVSRDVEESLLNGDSSKCLNWCHENKSKLKKMKSTLEFKIRVQEFIEYIKKDHRMEAVKHARKYFTNMDEDQMTNVQQVMGLLAYSPDTTISPYKELFDTCGWKQIVDQFREDNFKLYQLSAHSIFTVVLQAGLSALKTPQCSKSGNGKNTDCPVCNPALNDIASTLPFAHCAQSHLVCNISGQTLNEYNHPLMLPNGYVYGEKSDNETIDSYESDDVDLSEHEDVEESYCALSWSDTAHTQGVKSLNQIVDKNTGKITCPRTSQTYDLREAEKIYVM